MVDRHREQMRHPKASKVNLTIPVIDYLTSQLEDRLCKSFPKLKPQYLLSNFISGIALTDWLEIKEAYEEFLPDPHSADGEFELWKQYLLVQLSVKHC